MRRIPSFVKSPPMAVAFVALLAALCGTAVALPGSNTVTSGDIRNGAVKTQDIGNSTVRGRDVRKDTLTGSDVNEGSLRTVPSAAKATSAQSATTAGNAQSVDGASVGRILYRGPVNGPDTTILNLGGLQVIANCIGENVNLRAKTSFNDSAIKATIESSANAADSLGDTDGSNAVFYTESDDFDANETIDLLPFSDGLGESDVDDSSMGSLTFVTPAGKVVTASYGIDRQVIGATCVVFGTATASG